MAFNNSFTAITGATYTAAQYNTYTRDNLTAIWVYTTAGDIAYATGATTLARLGIGSNYKVVRSNGSAPTWDKVLQEARVYKTADQSYSSGAAAEIAFNAEILDEYGWHNNSTNNERITVTQTGVYVPFLKIYFNKDTGGSGTFVLSMDILLNGAATPNSSNPLREIDAVTKHAICGGIPIAMTAGQYVTARFSQNSGGSGKIINGSGATVFALLRIG